MDATMTVLDVAVVALSAILTMLTLATAVSYRERRFVLVSLSILAIGVVGALGLADLIWVGSVPDADLGSVSALVLVASEVFLYLSLVIGRRPKEVALRLEHDSLIDA